jgi:oligoendopeptidase F
MSPTPPPFSQTRWSLADLFPAINSPELEDAFTKLEALVAAFEVVRPELTAEITPARFIEIIHLDEEATKLASRIGAFANLSFTEDTQDQAVLSLLARVDQFMADLGNRTMFFSLWWKDLPDDVAERLMDEAGDYRYWLEEIRHFKPHTLSEAEEKIVNIKNVTGASALGTLYDAITNRYIFKITVDGEEKEVTRGELMVYARHANPEYRAAAYQELYRVYGQDAPILGQIYQTIVRDWRNEQVSLRKFSSPISARNLANDVPDAVVDTLLNVCQRNAPIFQRFFRLKARLLGLEKLRRYDVYAPLTHSDKKYSFNEAVYTVLDSFYEFAPKVSELARRVFSVGHVDSEVRKGKKGGAFCASVLPELAPWVQLNYQGRADDVATMAHELGHAIHSMLASSHTLYTFHASLPLAETASTFGEMILIDRLLADESDATVRRDLLFKQMDDAYATIGRQAFFALFERQAHQMIADNASVDELGAAYMENLKTQFGDAVEISEEFQWEWVSIPHIYQVPFYVYAYSFGQLLVLALYQQFKKEGESFKPRYLKILSTGGSDAPARILANAGIDIYQDSFWQGGFDVLDSLVSQLEVM